MKNHFFKIIQYNKLCLDDMNYRNIITEEINSTFKSFLIIVSENIVMIYLLVIMKHSYFIAIKCGYYLMIWIAIRIYIYTGRYLT